MSFFFYRQPSYDQQRAWLPSHRAYRSFATHRHDCGEACRKACLHAFWLRIVPYITQRSILSRIRQLFIRPFFGWIDSHAWRSRATRKHVSGLLLYFSSSREVYRSSQQQFSCAQRAQRKFRMEAGRNFGKICQKLTFCYIPLFLCFRMLIC